MAAKKLLVKPTKTVKKQLTKVKKKGVKPGKILLKNKKKAKLAKSSGTLTAAQTGKLVKKAANIPLFKRQNIQIPGWNHSDLLKLVKLMEANIPGVDRKKYNVTESVLDWNKISFGGHSAEDCKKGWLEMERLLRHYKILKEIANDIRVFVNDYFSGERKSGRKMTKKKKKTKKQKNNKEKQNVRTPSQETNIQMDASEDEEL